MSRFILLCVLLGTSIVLIMFGGLETGSQGQVQECVDWVQIPTCERQASSQGQVQECRDWGTKCWTPYEAVYCHVPKKPTMCFIYVKPKFFNKEGMSNLAQHFSKWSPEVKGIIFQIYDDKSLIESYLLSRGHDTGMIGRRRGFYVRGGGRETLVYKTGEKGNEFDDAIRIK